MISIEGLLEDEQGLSMGEMFEDHVWFKDRWMVASLCDEWLTTLCGLILG
jgi:hypothetical protein